MVRLCLVPNVSSVTIVQSGPLLGLNAVCLLSPHISITDIRLNRQLELQLFCFFSAVLFISFLNLEKLNAANILLLCK